MMNRSDKKAVYKKRQLFGCRFFMTYCACMERSTLLKGYYHNTSTITILLVIREKKYGLIISISCCFH